MQRKQLILGIADELIVDLFAGGGGMSTAIEQATGRHVDIAINHNDDALSMHRVNHPQTRHFVADVFEVDPRAVTRGKPVGLLHLSPDCTHHSQAAGGQPRDRKIRALSWVGLRWVGQVRPRVVTLENVKQIEKWGPLIAKRDPATGRVLRLDGTVAARGERVPLEQQYLVPDKKREGVTWERFKRLFREQGYAIETQTRVAAKWGAGTTRDRLFAIARCDGEPIVWPEPTHHQKPKRGQQRWKAAADSIDFNLPCPSIFLDKAGARKHGVKRPLADATCRRIAKGIKKFVLDAADPFIVQITRTADDRAYAVDDPLRVITTANGGEFAFVAPTVVPVTHQGGDRVQDVRNPMPTITGANRGELMVCSPVLIQAAHGEGKPGGVQRWGSGALDITGPIGAVTANGGSFSLAAPVLAKLRGDSDGRAITEPMPTITSGAGAARPAGAAHALGLIAPTLVQTGYGEREGQAARTLDIGQPLGTVVGSGKHGVVSAFLAQHNTQRTGVTSGHDAREPLSTIIGSGSHQSVVAAHLLQLRNNCDGRAADEPIRTISAGGEHHAAVSAFLEQYNGPDAAAFQPSGLTAEQEAGALRVAAFLISYYGNGDAISTADPLDTVTTRDRLALVTVMIKGHPYVIVDIGMRMLTPRELYRAQGFPEHYIIDRGHDGRVFSKSAQVRMVGNSVSPPPAQALIEANYFSIRKQTKHRAVAYRKQSNQRAVA
ncbi:DNA cytosine methyltransferase [Nevskia sp.]|uniref:DNA cytosine methyltransferase n=1 Tax=Nevskia sp. TaxID=1929292 RepID=UPI0025D1FE5D|nr:DNA cytosine methyltransferase [Nevskia sp.]